MSLVVSPIVYKGLEYIPRGFSHRISEASTAIRFFFEVIFVFRDPGWF